MSSLHDKGFAINAQYPDIEHLRRCAERRIPRFAFEYLEGGCNDEINLRRNIEDIKKVLLQPYYLRDYSPVDVSVEIFGRRYNSPFGISPIGLQGMMWPGASEILAQAAVDFNIPYVLSTVGTASIEKIAEITRGSAWFQLYHPREEKMVDDILRRLEVAGYDVLVLLCDVPTFGYRAKEIKNGLSIPPKMSLRNIAQMIASPRWSLGQLMAGPPRFRTLDPYIPKGLNLRHLGEFMNRTFDGRLNEDRVKSLRDKWKGKLVLKGVSSLEDTQKAINWGLDGIIVSNHGGRQLDAGESSIESMSRIAHSYKNQLTVMMDSGIRNGSDIACCLARGAAFTFLGRSFMYGVSALGREGGRQTIAILDRQLRQVMEQLCCEKLSDLPSHLLE